MNYTYCSRPDLLRHLSVLESEVSTLTAERDRLSAQLNELEKTARRLRLDEAEALNGLERAEDKIAAQSERIAALEKALSETPTKNWLAKWLKEGKDMDIAELYRLFAQRVLGRAKDLAAARSCTESPLGRQEE